MHFRGEQACDWSSDFVYAKSLLLTRSQSQRTQALQQPEDWLLKSLRGLGKRSFSGNLTPKDKEELHTRLATVGREFNKGHISEDEYHAYVDALLRKNCGKENSELSQTLSLRSRPHSAPHSRHVPAPRQENESARPVLTRTLPRRAPTYEESKYQKSVRDRSARERLRALAWMQKVARREEEVADVESLWARAHDGQRSVAREVVVSGAPHRTHETAIRELLDGFGAIDAIDPRESQGGARSFLVRFHSAEQAARAARAGTLSLETSVRASPLPRDSDRLSLRRICSRWGKVLSVIEVADDRTNANTSRRSAIVVFESRAAAKKAMGEHVIQASAELHVTGIPLDAKEEHVRGAFGGVRGGVTTVAFDPVQVSTTKSAVVAFTSAQLAERAVGIREIAITGRGGAISALAKAQANAYKGHAAPWHSTLKARPFANYEMHSYQFGHQPCTTREFKKRAAGTYGVQHRNKELAGSSMRFTTRRVKVKAQVCTTTLCLYAEPQTLNLALASKEFE